MKKFCTITLLLLLVSAGVSSKSITQFELNNGLKVLIKEVQSPGLVAMIWYRVGSSDEHYGITGISHALEHMMFKGTSHYGPNEYSKIIAARGGQENAMTTRDYTAYFAKIAPSNLPEFLKLEADRMEYLTLSPDEFRKEIKVVQEERRMRTEDNPQALAYERMMALTHIASPYHHPVVGWMNDLEHMTINDLKNWYQRWYRPNNATIVLVGNIKPKLALLEIKKYFSKIKPRSLAPRKPNEEIKHFGLRALQLSLRTKLPLLAMSYNTPSLGSNPNDKAPFALELIAYILDGGDSARFSQHLIRGKHLASQISTGYDLYSRYASAYMIIGVPTEKTSLDQLKIEINKEITELKSKPVPKTLLARIKRQLIASKIFQKDALFAEAMEMGTLSMSQLPQKVATDYIKNIEAVTPQMLQKVAQTYFTDDNLTVVRLKQSPKANAQ